MHSDAIDADGISKKIVNLTLSSLLTHITDIFHRLLRDLVFPGLWKRSIVVPVNKVPNCLSAL